MSNPKERAAIRTKQSPFLPENYAKLLESCDHESDIFAKLCDSYENLEIETWRRELVDAGLLHTARDLFQFYEDMTRSSKFLRSEKHHQLIRTFLLLENVFRNVLLRPYIPAYRNISKDCGLYRTSLKTEANQLFRDLHFEEKVPGLLTYGEMDRGKTTVYAITCFIFWHNLTVQLNQ